MSTTSVLNSVLAATTGSSASAIDVTGAVNAILYADRAPERGWQAEQTTLASQTSALNQIETQSSTLSEDLSALQDPGGTLSSVSATSTDSSIVTATAAPGTAVGTHTVVVTNSAATASWYTSEVTSSSAELPSGNFSITSGGTTTSFSTGSGSGNDTLNELATSINSQSLGVTASVVTDSNGARLSIVANSSGSAANFTVSQTGGLTFTQPTVGTDASLTVDGVPITSASNTVTGAISGLTLNLQGAAAGTEIGVTLAPDTSAITQAISTFVTDYNSLITNVNSQFAYDGSSQTAGPLQADSTVQSFQSDLLGSTNYNSGSGAYTTLASLGISTNQDGTLSLDNTALTNAIAANPTGVAGFFQGSASNGFASSLQNSLTTYTDPTQGAFTVDLSSISSENKELTDQTNTLELYLATQQTLLTTQYNNADIALEQLPQTLKQINALLNPNNNSSTNG